MRRTLLAPIAILTLLATSCGARGAAPAAPAQSQQQQAPASGATTSGATTTIKFNHVVTRDTPKGRAAERFAEFGVGCVVLCDQDHTGGFFVEAMNDSRTK